MRVRRREGDGAGGSAHRGRGYASGPNAGRDRDGQRVAGE